MDDDMREKEFWMSVRQALLVMVDAIERRWMVAPRTAVLRKMIASRDDINTIDA